MRLSQKMPHEKAKEVPCRPRQMWQLPPFLLPQDIMRSSEDVEEVCIVA
jgi:hypothetical protein